jgi:glycogen operon protein
LIGAVASRVSGSSDLYEWEGRVPSSSINFVTCYDGFTLCDLISYHGKHNEANGEDNRDGNNDNLSSNCGAEGETNEPNIVSLRQQQAKNFMAILLLSQGVPMILAGDEVLRTQRGNNNAYCQDNELSWVDWKETASITGFTSFVRQMIAFRKARPALRRSRFFDGKPNPETGRRDVTWLSGAGGLLSREEWHRPVCEVFGALLDAPDRAAVTPAEGADHRPLLLLFNHGEAVSPFTLPGGAETGWALVFDTSCDPAFVDEALLCHGSAAYELQPRSMACLVLRNDSRAV